MTKKFKNGDLNSNKRNSFSFYEFFSSGNLQWALLHTLDFTCHGAINKTIVAEHCSSCKKNVITIVQITVILPTFQLKLLEMIENSMKSIAIVYDPFYGFVLSSCTLHFTSIENTNIFTLIRLSIYWRNWILEMNK